MKTSNSLMSSSGTDQVSPNFDKDDTYFGVFCKIFIGFTFPWPLNALDVSHPEYAWSTIRDVHYSGVLAFTSSVMFSNLRLLPVAVSKRTVMPFSLESMMEKYEKYICPGLGFLLCDNDNLDLQHTYSITKFLYRTLLAKTVVLL